MEVKFTQKWIEDLLKEYFDKGSITSEDLEQIQYIRIGEDFANSFILEISNEEPPVPFSDPMGGEEWESCVLNDERLKKFVEENIADNFQQLFGEGPYQIITPYLDDYEGELEEGDYDKAEKFADTVTKKSFFNKMDDYKKFEEWYDNTCKHILDDIGLFPNVKVLRVQGGSYKDFSFLEKLNKLETLELVEAEFETTNGFDNLAKLKQLTCWMD